MGERGEDSAFNSAFGNYDASDPRGARHASALDTEGHETQLPHLPAISSGPMQGIQEILDMLPESGDISSCTDSNEEHDIYGDAPDAGNIQKGSVAPIR